MRSKHKSVRLSKYLAISIIPFCLGSFVSSSAWATPAQVLLIRHAEKSGDGGLSTQGEERAQALVQYFETNPDVTRFGTPVAIYAMAPSSGDTGIRPTETVTPLATALGLPILNRYAKKDVAGLAREILSAPEYDGKMVLICWEHKKISEIAAYLGVSPEPAKWSKDVYDQVWEIDYSGGGVSEFREFRQAITLP